MGLTAPTHLLFGRGSDILAPMNRRHAPGEVGAADIRLVAAALGWRSLHAQVIARPRLTAWRGRNSNRRGFWLFGLGDQVQPFDLLAGGVSPRCGVGDLNAVDVGR